MSLCLGARRGWKRLLGRSVAVGVLGWLLLLLGIGCLTSGVWLMATPIDASRLADSTARTSLDDIGRALLADIARVVKPAMERTQKLANDPAVRAALLSGNQQQLTEVCNEAIADSTEVDAVALFDRSGKILAINTNYTSGQPIEPQRVNRILRMNFDNRAIINQCVHNSGKDRVLEFQTACDITPALFDSTGLSIAYSALVRDPATGEKIGVVSSRLRFERLSDLIKSREVGGRANSIEFVTDQGDYFSEQINAGHAAPPIPPRVLAADVAPLVSGAAKSTFAHYDNDYLVLFRLTEFATITGGGIQVMVTADESWLAAEANQSRKLLASGFIAGGLTCLLVAGTIFITSPLRRGARSRALLAAVVEYSCDAIISESLDGRILSWNLAAEHIFGFRADAVMGRTISFLLPAEKVEQQGNIRDGARRGLPVPPFDTTFIRNDGQRVEISLSLSPIRDCTGKVIGIAKIARDIADRKQMEADLVSSDEQLRQSHKLEAVGSLAGGIAHEFNNLLQVVRGYGQYAMDGLLPDDQRYQDLQQVIKAADRATALTRQLLGFSRRQTLERVTFDHQEVVTDLVRLLRPIIGEHIEVEINLAFDVKPIHADRMLLQQMLLNLCINSRDAMLGGGRLAINTRRVELSEKYCEIHSILKPGSYLTFSVSDTGCGMTPEVKERIFEPFFTTKAVGQGTGLGLAMVYGCVQQHGGIINVYSEVGLGTMFKIYLPLAEGDQSCAEVEAVPCATGGNETILVAEDEPGVRKLAVRILTKAGYAVLEAANGVEAVEVFKANAQVISLVILDAVMPKLTGHQAYEQIKLVNPPIPVIFCSGYDPETGPVQSLVSQGCRLVQKPYDPDWLVHEVRAALDEQSAVANHGECHQNLLQGAGS